MHKRLWSDWRVVSYDVSAVLFVFLPYDKVYESRFVTEMLNIKLQNNTQYNVSPNRR